MRATITYIGRLLSLVPAELGPLFEEELTATLNERDPPTEKNGWKAGKLYSEEKLWWYDQHPDTKERQFFTFSGFGERIRTKLELHGYEVLEEDLLPNALPAPDLSRLKGISWRGCQQEVYVTALAVRCGMIDCPTGWGKTWLISQIIKAYPTAKIIVTTASKEVAKDIHKGLCEYDAAIGFVGGGVRDVQRVTVAITKSIKHCARNADFIIFDEAHELGSEFYRNTLVEFTNSKFLAFSASPKGRSDGSDLFLEAMFGPVVYYVPYQEAVVSGNVVPIEVRFYPVTQGPEVKEMSDDKKNRFGIWTNSYRNETIARAVGDVFKECKDPQILIMTAVAEHAYWIRQVLPQFTVVTGEVDAKRRDQFRRLGILGEDEETVSDEQRAIYKKQFEKRELKYAISTKIWSRGVNFLDLDYMVRADGSASAIASTQYPGRLSRLGSDGEKEGGVLIDLMDLFSSPLTWRSKTRKKDYASRGWKIVTKV